MFDRKFLYTLAAIGAVVVTAVTLDAMPGSEPETTHITEYGEAANVRRSDLPRERTTPGYTAAQEQDPLPVYIIREYEGHIAVFAHGDSEPQIVLDTQVKFLPDFDRMQLGEGIEVWSYDELTALIEDYIS
ncbi:MAG: hypothetical protein FWH00_03025 [Oscillospiraceae bacterium]|nr:hypothetical protein [Oscillospiraceae bacterium]